MGPDELRVVVARAGAEAEARARRDGARAFGGNILVLPPAQLADASSTAVRGALDRRDHAALAAMCGEEVAAALRAE